MKRLIAFTVITALLALNLLALSAPAQHTTHAQGDSGNAAPRGDRILSIDVTEAAEEDYETAFLLARDLGMESVGLSLDWVDIETQPGDYDLSWFEIANAFYPAYDMPIVLTIRPIHTGSLRVPPDLQTTRFDDPVMIARFTALLDAIQTAMPDVELTALVIGSEIDGYLGTLSYRWEYYTAFAAAAADHARDLWPGVPIAFEVMFPGFEGPAREYVRALNAYADVIGVSYYPLNPDFTVDDPAIVAADFAWLVEEYPDTPIHFYQLGYPSSPVLGSSEDQQADFVRAVFAAWDDHADQITLVDFTWLTDRDAASVDVFKEAYGIVNEAFAAFLSTLGLRHHDGTAKPALDALRDEAAARGWGS